MSAYKHLTDLLKICSVLPALAIMPAVAAETSNDPNAVGQWSGNKYIEEENVKRGGGVLNLATGDTYQSDYIQAGLVSGNSISVTKTGGGVGNDVYAQGSVLYSHGSLGGISGTFKNNSVNTSAAERSKASANGGAFALYAGTNIKSISGDFIGNSATSKYTGKDGKYADGNQVSAGGGAIHIEGQYGNNVVKIGEIDGDFTSNSANGDAYANGGAIYIKGGADREGNSGYAVTVDMIDGDFSRNSVTATADKGAFVDAAYMKNSTGGAVSIKEENGAATVTIDGDFEYNTVTTNATNAFGGAIYNEGTLTLADSDFTYNKAASTSGKSRGGAIYNAATNAKGDTVAGSVTINGDVDIIGNSAGWGGAIWNEGTLVFNNNGQQVTFGGNSATAVNAGGGAIYNNGSIGTLSHMLFQGNSADMGGAINNSWLDGKGGQIETITNSFFVGNVSKNGGAIRSNSHIGSITGVRFERNVSANGGALWNGSYATLNKIGSVDTINDVQFLYNAATASSKGDRQGGAITNGGVINLVSNTDFIGNQAGDIGGAIANTVSQAGKTPTITLQNVLFDSNSAGKNGGAIHNVSGSVVNLKGNNTFVNNFAGGVANDIHNLGTLNITGGVTTMTGGITGDTGELTISSGATLDIGTASIQQNNINVQGTLAADLLNANSFAKISVGKDGGFSAGNGSLDFTFGAAGTYDIGVDLTSDMLANADDNALYNVSVSDGNIVVATKNVATIAKDNGLANESAAVLVGLANSGNNAMNVMAIRAQDALKQGDAQYVQAETKKLLPQDTPVAQSVASSAQSQVLSLAAGRMSGNALVGRSGGDAANMDYGVWAQGLMNHSKYADKFSGDTYGVAVGADALINGKYTVGIGYAYNETDIDATNDTSIDSSSLFVYGQYKPTQWYINAALNYTMANYTESGVAFGVASGYEYDVDSFGGQIMTGYDFASGLTPEVGARYLHIATDDYNNGFNVENEDTNYLTGVAGLKYAFEIESDARLKFRPEIRAAATYDFLSDEAVTTVTIPGASAYVLNGERLSRFGGEFGIGLSALYEGWEISVNYDLDLHEDYTSQTGMLKFRYNF